MSQLPPPNFGNIPAAFNNMNGFTGNMMGPTPSFFGRPPNPSLGFPPRLPMNSFASYPGAQFMPGIWPNVNSLRPQFHHHVVHPPQGNYSSQQQRPQVTNVQGQTTEYSCAACQKEFSSKETLNAHLGAHVQCTYEGCTFKAGRKILKLHWIQTHETGKMRIKLNTPGEIAKWKEERKRKYPTIANVERKMEEEAKRKQSGDVLKTKNFRYRRGQRRGRTFQRGGHNHFNNRSHTRKGPVGLNDRRAAENQSTEHSKNGNQARTSDDAKRMENGEDPLSLVLDGYDEEDETDDKTKGRLSTQKELSSTHTAQAEPCSAMSGISALSSLCSAYASDSEVEEEPSEINNNKHTKCSPNERDSRKCTNKLEVGMAVKSTTELRHEVKHETGSRSKRPRRRSRKNTSKANSKSMGIQKSTLLEKLLAPEVRHERNAILQCLRHIVKRNFFGAGDMSNLSENIVKNENCDEFVNKSL